MLTDIKKINPET